MTLSEAIDVAMDSIRTVAEDTSPNYELVPQDILAEAAAMLQKAKPFIEAAVGWAELHGIVPDGEMPTLAQVDAAVERGLAFIATYREMLK